MIKLFKVSTARLSISPQKRNIYLNTKKEIIVAIAKNQSKVQMVPLIPVPKKKNKIVAVKFLTNLALKQDSNQVIKHQF